MYAQDTVGQRSHGRTSPKPLRDSPEPLVEGILVIFGDMKLKILYLMPALLSKTVISVVSNVF
jgi:hypothetical protein